MEKMTKQEWFQMISIMVTVLLGVFKSDTNSQVIYPILCIVIAIIVINMIYNKTKANRNLSNTAVITNSKKYMKYLLKVVKANSKVLKKRGYVVSLHKTEKINKQLVKKMKGNYDYSDDEIKDLKNKLYNDLDMYYKDTKRKYTDSTTLKASKSINEEMKYSNDDQALAAFELIQKTISDMRRILLQLEQHNLRIKFGKYITKYSVNISYQIKSYLDDIGWTHILLGDNKKGTLAINMALSLIEYKTTDVDVSKLDKESVDDYYAYMLLKARAFRHLGTTYYTYKYSPLKVKEALEKGLEIVNSADFKYYYINNEDSNTVKKYYAMKEGLEYNKLLFQYYEHLKNRDLSDSSFINLYNKANEIKKENEDLINRKIGDNHRFIKLLTFRNQIYKEIKSKEFVENNNDNIDSDLHSIEEVLDKNIYFDEAMEVYVCQKLEKLYKDIDQLFIKK